MSPIRNPTRDDFLRRACQEFHFLVAEFGFVEDTLPDSEDGNPYQVRYRSRTTLVIVEGINWGYGINVLLGQLGRRILRSEHTFPLWPVVQLRRPDLNTGLATGDQLAQLSSWATALRESAQDVLRGDFSVRAEAEKISRDVASRQASEDRAKHAAWQYRDDMKKAHAAFRARDYATVLALLMKHEARLTPAERQKLEYTKRRGN